MSIWGSFDSSWKNLKQWIQEHPTPNPFIFNIRQSKGNMDNGHGMLDALNMTVSATHSSSQAAVWEVLAGVFAWSSLFISIWAVSQHLIHYNKPYLQKYVVRILWMVPIYGMNAWLGMKLPAASIYLDTLRECYEAFVIYSFMKYLLNFLYREMDMETMIECKPPQQHLFPLCWLTPLPGGRRFLHKIKHGVLQYTIARPLTTIVALLSEMIGIYHEGSYSLGSTYLYLFLVNNISQMIAMYCLVIFYTCYRNELSPMKPLAKFLCIKAVVFFSFFQGVLIGILIEFGIITRAVVVTSDADKVAIQRNLQDFLICFEMMIAGIAHLFAFSHRPYVDLAASSDGCCTSLMRVLDTSDERSDMTDHLRQVYRKARDTWTNKTNPYEPTESTTLIALQPRGRNASSNAAHTQGHFSYT
jgi:hypothetical protein